MQAHRPISVVILYTHPLLGEGLLGLLAAEPGVDVVAIRSDELDLVEQALERSPQVVIFERGDPDRAVGILELVPDALVIDVAIGPGPTFTYRRDEISAVPDAILDVIRHAPTRRFGEPVAPTLIAPRLATRS